MLVKIVTLALTAGIVLYLFFYLPKRLKAGRGARLRYIIFCIFAVLFAVLLLKAFL